MAVHAIGGDACSVCVCKRFLVLVFFKKGEGSVWHARPTREPTREPTCAAAEAADPLGPAWVTAKAGALNDDQSPSREQARTFSRKHGGSQRQPNKK
jgi:hypothetical protein